MNRKLKVILGISLILTIVVISCIIYADNLSKGKIIAQSTNNIENSPDKDIILFEINGEKVTKQEYELHSEGLLQAQSKYNADDIFKEFVKRKVLVQEAINEGITVSDEEALEDTKKRYYACKEAGGQNYEEIKEFIEEKGLTEDEYFQECINGTKKVLLVNKLFNKFVEERSLEKTDSAKEFDKFREELYEKVNINLIDDSVKNIKIK